MSYLEVDRLTLKKGEFHLSCSLSLEKGCIGVLLGPSGSGKSTLLRCISGLDTPDSGSISLAGCSLGNLPPEKRNIGFVFQDLALFDHLDGRGNIEFGMRLRKIAAATRMRRTDVLARTMKMAQLLSRKPGNMSGGERQRLALARSIAVEPDLMLLDEPLSALDAPLRKELRAFIRTSLKDLSSTALHVTHDVDEALEMADKLFLMRSGRILAAGDPETIFANPPNSWSVGFLSLGIALSAEIIAAKGNYVTVKTIAGEMTVPEPEKQAEACSVFLPSAQARLHRPEELSSIRKDRSNVLEFKVDKISFSGRGRKMTVSSVMEPAVRDTFETGIDSDWSVGERVAAEYPINSCRLLTQAEP